VTEPPKDPSPQRRNSGTGTSDKDDDDVFGETDNKQDNDDDDEDSDDDLFGTASRKLLKIDVDFDRASEAIQSGGSGAKKRRRSSTESAGSDGVGGTTRSKPRRRASTQHLSASALLELMDRVATQQAKFDKVTSKLKNFRELYGDDSNTKGIETLVGNDLLEEYKKTLKNEQDIAKCQRELHAIAQTRRGLELEALKYLPWLERALKQDKDDVDLSQKYRRQLDLFKGVHQATKEARDRRLKEEALRAQREEELLKQQREEEERRKFMESAMSKQTEAQPGMVWNRATGEYQHLNQEESWRD